ncbi:protein SYM1 [Nicotiana tabacum]|uniref:PXMP2/4 family protein 4 n=1 Tax=Nicotiana tabacum TaxID=4097 RepID=A0A1S3ZRU2_TOBAC|nr:PXMP2/4 family protein 4-like [Nicotiana tomentosiformis]XP_016467049.1 PREDICTED: PXMP2/4 family protein 4-like [Nicotiana tabacum]
MGLNFLTSLAKRTIIQHSKRCFTSKNSVSRIWTDSHSCTNNFKTTTIPTTPSSFSSLFILRKSYSSASSKTQLGFLRWYLGALESRPIITKSVSSAIIYAAADLTSQMITMSPSDSLDIIRTLRMAGFGLLILGTAQHHWFNFMGRVLPNRDIVSTLKKLLMGQLAFGPVINSVFFSFNAALQGENGEEIAARLKRDLLPTMMNGLMYWPFCDFLTYKVIPVHLQPLANSAFAYAWSIYLTYVASLKKAVAV